MEYLETIAAQVGIATWLLIIILLWSAVWKLLALWKSARNNNLIWFIVIAVINSVGILPILYIFVFSKLKYKAVKPKKAKKSVKKKK
ncbi:hypothetical protein KAI04_03345 [Candidatus Pacearchaeota archaeon]|nr:hypothetical protein [Candidatus Pacearchaeota archaeon]